MKESCDLLERYLTARQTNPELYTNLTLLDPAIAEIVDNGYIVPMIERDEYGHQVLLIRPDAFNREKYTTFHLSRVFNMVFEVLLSDQQNQVAGYTFIVDDSNASIKNLTSLNLADVKRMVKILQVSFFNLDYWFIYLLVSSSIYCLYVLSIYVYMYIDYYI